MRVIPLPAATLLALAAVVTATACADASSEAGDESALTEGCPSPNATTQKALAEIPAVAETCDDVAPPSVPPPRPFRGNIPFALSFTPSFHRGRDAFYAELRRVRFLAIR